MELTESSGGCLPRPRLGSFSNWSVRFCGSFSVRAKELVQYLVLGGGVIAKKDETPSHIIIGNNVAIDELDHPKDCEILNESQFLHYSLEPMTPSDTKMLEFIRGERRKLQGENCFKVVANSPSPIRLVKRMAPLILHKKREFNEVSEKENLPATKQQKSEGKDEVHSGLFELAQVAEEKNDDICGSMKPKGTTLFKYSPIPTSYPPVSFRFDSPPKKFPPSLTKNNQEASTTTEQCSNKFSGKTFVLLGHFAIDRVEIVRNIEMNGGVVIKHGNLSGKVTHMIYAKKTENNVKYKNALERRIELWSEEEFNVKLSQ